MAVILAHVVHVNSHQTVDVCHYSVFLHLQIAGVAAQNRIAVRISGAGDVADHGRTGQNNIGAVPVVNCHAIPALPHFSIGFDTGNRAGNRHLAAVVHIDTATDDIFDFRAFLHVKCSALNPDRTGRAIASGRPFYTVGNRRVLNQAAAFHRQRGTAGDVYRRHAPEVLKHRTAAQRDGRRRSARKPVSRKHTFLNKISVVDRVRAVALTGSFRKDASHVFSLIVQRDIHQTERRVDTGRRNFKESRIVKTAFVVSDRGKVVTAQELMTTAVDRDLLICYTHTAGNGHVAQKHNRIPCLRFSDCFCKRRIRSVLAAR